MANEFLVDWPLDQATQDEATQHERIRHVLYGSPRAIARTIHQLHNQGYAEATAWSRPQPTEIPGEFMSLLLRYLLLE